MNKEEREVYEYINKIEPYCQLCGSPYKLHRHHIRYRSEFGKKTNPTYIGNIIVLCDKCHRLVHSNKKYWQPKLIELDKKIRERNDLDESNSNNTNNMYYINNNF